MKGLNCHRFLREGEALKLIIFSVEKGLTSVLLVPIMQKYLSLSGRERINWVQFIVNINFYTGKINFYWERKGQEGKGVKLNMQGREQKGEKGRGNINFYIISQKGRSYHQLLTWSERVKLIMHKLIMLLTLSSPAKYCL